MSNTKWEDGLEAVENSRYDQYGFSDLNEFEGINNGMRVLQSGEETLQIEDKTKDRTSPNEDLVKLLDRRSEFTPDMRELKQMSDLQLVFVYGTLKKGHGNHYLLENSIYLGEGHTRSYYCWLKRKGFPVVMERAMGMSPEFSGKIKGEVYAVDLSTLAALDQLEANGTMYNRKKVQVNLRDQFVEAEHNPKFTGRPFKPCYMYVGDDTYWRGSEYDEHVTIENGPMHKW